MTSAKSLILALILIFVGFGAAPSRAAVVKFSQVDYTVDVGDLLALEILIEFEGGDPAMDLFSFGTRLLPDPTAALVLDSIEVVSALNFNGVLGPPAQTNTDLAVLGAKGTIEFLVGVDYAGPLLATYNVRINAVGNFTFGLDFFNTLGPTEQIFIGGNGQVLDSVITFGEATVNVVPEPGAAVLVLLACLLPVMRHARRLRGREGSGADAAE